MALEWILSFNRFWCNQYLSRLPMLILLCNIRKCSSTPYQGHSCIQFWARREHPHRLRKPFALLYTSCMKGSLPHLFAVAQFYKNQNIQIRMIPIDLAFSPMWRYWATHLSIYSAGLFNFCLRGFLKQFYLSKHHEDSLYHYSKISDTLSICSTQSPFSLAEALYC